MKKKLIVYYSYTGNTKMIVDILKDNLDVDIVRLETIKPYSGSYDDVVEQGKKETDSKYMPEIKEIGINLKDYDEILLGSPVWWYTFAPAVRTFLSKYDLSGKRIVPFITNGGWIGSTVDDIKSLANNSQVKNAINIKFNGSDLETSMNEINAWIDRL
ncbi:flavodoxin [Anaerofustis stercorihominis]|uniref:Flavodoxin n=1 Tax=Anaerofustis stercorihominis TaxID=214853 RepID=A0A3E3DVM7_9FIRM|nr:flavodoxin [Anaerofustis stercorihominis]RGD73205.1 flavodoxin [Anaerofustis stercorihominis]